MQLPVKAHYATLAMLALADKHESREVLPARVIACEQGIPSQFLGQILQQLRAAGLIASTRGANGGFYLEQPPAAITLSEVVHAVCPPSSSLAVEGASPLSAVVLDVWEELKEQQQQLLQRLTLADLLARLDTSANVMFYI
ncbi:MAG: Rrf2 family transcriptional regulator [Planctomycetales bacterium]|nr:Rrf2 family transcriptional regulator [Planctomycetales bacterium]